MLRFALPTTLAPRVNDPKYRQFEKSGSAWELQPAFSTIKNRNAGWNLVASGLIALAICHRHLRWLLIHVQLGTDGLQTGSKRGNLFLQSRDGCFLLIHFAVCF